MLAEASMCPCFSVDVTLLPVEGNQGRLSTELCEGPLVPLGSTCLAFSPLLHLFVGRAVMALTQSTTFSGVLKFSSQDREFSSQASYKTKIFFEENRPKGRSLLEIKPGSAFP